MPKSQLNMIVINEIEIGFCRWILLRNWQQNLEINKRYYTNKEIIEKVEKNLVKPDHIFPQALNLTTLTEKPRPAT